MLMSLYPQVDEAREKEVPMTTTPIAPFAPHLRTSALCHPRFNGQHIEYPTFQGEIHIAAARGRNPGQAVLDALATFAEAPIWIELVHCKRDDHNQLSATFWSMHGMLVDAAEPAPNTVKKVLVHIGAGEVAEVAIAAAFADKDVIVYFDATLGWKHYVMPAEEVA